MRRMGGGDQCQVWDQWKTGPVIAQTTPSVAKLGHPRQWRARMCSGFYGTARLDKCCAPRNHWGMARFRPRLAVRALILSEDRLLLVNAFAGGRSDLWCAPGGGCDAGHSLNENLIREVHEETGLRVAVGSPALVNEFHDPKSGFHQVEVFFRCTLVSGELDARWQDPEGVVTKRQFFSRQEMAAGGMRFKPDSLPEAAWGTSCRYDPLEVIVR